LTPSNEYSRVYVAELDEPPEPPEPPEPAPILEEPPPQATTPRPIRVANRLVATPAGTALGRIDAAFMWVLAGVWNLSDRS
jgi:hypothetical protein